MILGCTQLGMPDLCGRNMARAAKPKSRFRLSPVASLGLLAFAGALLIAVLVYKTQRQQDMESLAKFVLDRGRDTVVPDNAPTYFVKAVSNSGRTRAIQVRRRSTGDVEIFLLDLLPNSTAGYFYLADIGDGLVKAGYLDDELKSVDDAQERFQQELGFWKKWQREKLKSAAIPVRQQRPALFLL
jgi:hypothetical protein